MQGPQGICELLSADAPDLQIFKKVALCKTREVAAFEKIEKGQKIFARSVAFFGAYGHNGEREQ